MEQRILWAALTAIMLFCGTSCVAIKQVQGTVEKDVTVQKSTVSEAAAVQTSEEFNTNTSGDKLMEGFLDALPKSGVVHVTDEQGGTFQVDASDEAVSRIWDLLSAQNYAPLQVTDELFEGAHSTISLRYTTDQDYLIQLYGCPDSHPVYPGKTVIDLEKHGSGESELTTAATGLVAFEQISSLVSQLRDTLAVILDRESTFLNAGDLNGKSLTAWLQNGNRIMLAFSGSEGAYQQLFDDTGALLGTVPVAQPVIRMDATREESGYDYQMFTESRVIYKNSREPLTEKQYHLPADVKPSAWANTSGDFDVKYGKIIWTESDGAYICQTDGTERRQILMNSELSSLAGSLAVEGAMQTVAPRLLNEAEQAVIPIAVEEKLVGVVVVDLQSGTKTGFFDVFGKTRQVIAYPDKRSFAASGEKGVAVVDIVTSEIKRYPFTYENNNVWYSGDYKTFIVGEPQKDTLFHSYLVSARRPADREREFLTVRGRGQFEVIGASERSLLVYLGNHLQSGYHLLKLSNS